MPEEEATRRDRAMKDVWQRTLSQIPTTFGKVAHLASLRNENSGQYEHFGLAQLYSDEEADRVLGLSHHQVFREWLNFPLEKQRQDLENYLESIGDYAARQSGQALRDAASDTSDSHRRRSTRSGNR